MQRPGLKSYVILSPKKKKRLCHWPYIKGYIIILLGKEKEKKLWVYDFITDQGSHIINKKQYILMQYIPLTYWKEKKN